MSWPGIVLFYRFTSRRSFGIHRRRERSCPGSSQVEETAPIAGAPPQFDWPAIPNDSQTISTMLSFAIQLAAIGAVESVLTLQACNEITDTVPKISDSNQECFAQGVANLVCGLFRGEANGGAKGTR